MAGGIHTLFFVLSKSFHVFYVVLVSSYRLCCLPFLSCSVLEFFYGWQILIVYWVWYFHSPSWREFVSDFDLRSADLDLLVFHHLHKDDRVMFWYFVVRTCVLHRVLWYFPLLPGLCVFGARGRACARAHGRGRTRRTCASHVHRFPFSIANN